MIIQRASRGAAGASAKPTSATADSTTPAPDAAAVVKEVHPDPADANGRRPGQFHPLRDGLRPGAPARVHGVTGRCRCAAVVDAATDSHDEVFDPDAVAVLDRWASVGMVVPSIATKHNFDRSSTTSEGVTVGVKGRHAPRFGTDEHPAHWAL